MAKKRKQLTAAQLAAAEELLIEEDITMRPGLVAATPELMENLLAPKRKRRPRKAPKKKVKAAARTSPGKKKTAKPAAGKARKASPAKKKAARRRK